MSTHYVASWLPGHPEVMRVAEQPEDSSPPFLLLFRSLIPREGTDGERDRIRYAQRLFEGVRQPGSGQKFRRGLGFEIVSLGDPATDTLTDDDFKLFQTSLAHFIKGQEARRASFLAKTAA